LIGSIFGFDGYVNIPAGESAQQIRLRNKPQMMQLDFTIRCDDYDESYYETGAPKEFRSSLTILEQGREVLKKDIIVNDPLRYKGISIYQSSRGKLPSNELVLSFTSNKTMISFFTVIAVKASAPGAGSKSTAVLFWPAGLRPKAVSRSGRCGNSK